MDSELTDQPITPPCPNSVRSNEQQRGPMEDADPTSTRKRPRLDSGDRVHRSMSADPSRAASDDVAVGSAQETSLRADHTSEEPAPMILTPSKVTINVRESLDQTSPTRGSQHVDGAPPIPVADGNDEYLANHVAVSREEESSSPKVISVTSSPAHSPEIEVAEVEDINGDPGQTKWKRLESMATVTSVQEAKDTQAALLDQFPHTSGHTLKKTLGLLAVAFEKNDLGDGGIFESLATWVESYLQTTEPLSSQWWDMVQDERDFWNDFPCLVDALVRRSNTPMSGTIEMFYSDNGILDGQSPLQDFLAAYTALALRMARIDYHILTCQPPDSGPLPQFLSERYLRALSNIMYCNASFWEHLVDVSSYESKITVTAMVTRILQSPENGIAFMISLSRELLDRATKDPSSIPKSILPVAIVSRISQHYHILQQSIADADQELSVLSGALTSQTYDLFQLVDGKFKEFVSKQVSALSIEHSQTFIRQLSVLLRLSVASDNTLLEQAMNEKLSHVETLAREDRILLLELAWKFETLKRCIFDGRMEIRVQGVESMQSELVNVYNRFINNSSAQKDHPIPQYLAEFVLANRLVDYFVGVESHPQLIQRCGNVVGFLLVTNRYTNTETDIIWQAVTNSQDSRFIEAILGMLPNIFNIATYKVLLYFTVKMNELPISAFDGSMIQNAHNLLEALRRTWRSEALSFRMDIQPFHLCIRLIRQVAFTKSLDTLRRRLINQFATDQLSSLLQCGPSDRDRRIIYQECVQDISARNESSTGSLVAINILLSQDPEKYFASVSREWDLAHLVVGEFAYKIALEKSKEASSLMFQEGLDSRMFLIQNLILFVPDTITDDVGTQLWDFAVGSEAPNDRARQMAWMCFLNLIRKLSQRNCFIDRCVREYLPRLQPHFYTDGCLHFAQEVSNYHFRSAVCPPQDDKKQETTAEDLLWRLSLTAHSGTLERKAISMLVALYLDSPENARRTRAAIEAIHVAVVERCVRQLTLAASKLKSFHDGTSSGEDESMVIVLSKAEEQGQRLSFSRSLTILKEFLWGLRARPKYSPQLQTQSQLPYEHCNAQGELIQVRYQAFGDNGAGDMRIAEVRSLETLQEFASRLKLLTGFSKFTLISGGQKLSLGSHAKRPLQDLKIHLKGLLLVKKDPDAEEKSDSAPASGVRPAEAEILSHFHDLYSLLDMEDHLAREMLEFLLMFPPHKSITELVSSNETPLEKTFPTSAPCKVLYSIHALEYCLTSSPQEVSSRRDINIHGIRSLTLALTNLNFCIGPNGSAIDIVVATSLIRCLLQFLEGIKDLSAGAESLFPNHSALLDCLLMIVNDSLTIAQNADAGILASFGFAAILKISLHNETFWQRFKNMDMCSSLLKRLILDELRAQLRRQTAENIKAVCTHLDLTPAAQASEFIVHLWNCITTIIPECLQTEGTSQELFELANVILRRIDVSLHDSLSLTAYVDSWSDVLLRHSHNEFVGRESIDWIVYGLSNLLNWVLKHTVTSRNEVPIPDGLLVKTFHTHLFPPLSNSSQLGSNKLWAPILQSTTREQLYSIVLLLSNDIDHYQILLGLVKELLAHQDGSSAWSYGFAQLSDEYTFDQNWNVERSKTIRSPTGYPGIRNLSNTCYMNSLFTQLFMNVKFRHFMLGMKVADGAASQRLLLETQTLFGFMQDTMLKSVDSQGIVDSLITYDNAYIDVSVQMDVDEFYNLLFDRWESQILSADDKRTFRGFYGGQIVQQIKSKECPHISERLEPFSAIQCDIHGKSTLMDSLNAYVSGETMEGDNKYSCTSCGCYVDAVKRLACLKDIPDNLIFHLKRFDYDVMTGMRSKINDAFEFPHQIDMTPYHIDYQNDSSLSCKPDMFELVGVLVHSGTAESGHYYSYIHERPSTSGDRYSWVEFNDMDVSKFDPTTIGDQCFGGYSEANHYAHRFHKNWNAYMLFYERVELNASSDISLCLTPGIPAKCPMPPEVERQVIASNARYLRYYCLYDPVHAFFARQCLEQLRVVSKDICSDTHAVETQAIWLSLEYLERVLSRSKDCSDFSKMLASLTKVIGSCAKCCRIALEWVNTYDNTLRNLLLRCPNPKVRKEFTSMIARALQHLKHFEPEWYGLHISSSDVQEPFRGLRSSGVFTGLVSQLSELFPHLPAHGRGWDDFFGLLTELASLGEHEVHMLLSQGFLKNCLEILVVDHVKASRIRSESVHYSQYCRLLDKGRKFSLKNLTEFLAKVLENIDLAANYVRKREDRPCRRKMELTADEDYLMHMGYDLPRSKSTCVFLEKILNSGCNLEAAQRIVRMMTLAEPGFGMLEHVQRTLVNGINIEPAHLAEPFLESAISFCEATPSVDSAQNMIRCIAAEVDTIGENGGQEHLAFFNKARRIASLREGFPSGFFKLTVLRTVPQWAPALLHYKDEEVRVSTVEALRPLVFDHDITAMDDEEHAELIETAAKDLQVACTRRCNSLVELQKHVDPRSIERIVAVIRHCLTHYYTLENDSRSIAEAERVLTALEALTMSDADEATSEICYNGSDDVPTDSDEGFLTNSP
ncbi:hypothetical protein ACLMJK_004914 [Lecanora helva]